MDLDSLKKSVANLTLYDIKAGVRQVQNAVMNYTEMESKVREATNNDPWYVLKSMSCGCQISEGTSYRVAALPGRVSLPGHTLTSSQGRTLFSYARNCKRHPLLPATERDHASYL
jgi:hypothetical protein